MLNFGLGGVVQALETALLGRCLMTFGEDFLLSILVDNSVLHTITKGEDFFVKSELVENLHGARLERIGTPNNQRVGRFVKNPQRNTLTTQTRRDHKADRATCVATSAGETIGYCQADLQ